MKGILSFKEVSDYVYSHYGRRVELRQVSNKTVRITVAQKVILATIKISIDITIEKVEDTKIEISYSGSKGIDLLIKGALHLVNEKLPQLAPMITETSGSHLTIDLEKIEQAKVITEKLRLSDIIIQEDTLELTAELK
ncbi:MAG: hypothetical protein K2G29_08210 [Muribaculaceae bacterium]|nr:hypothetical protein [Muribaculaceae bacterium]